MEPCVAVIAETCPGLDEDMVEYIAGVLEGCIEGYSGVDGLIEGDDALGELLIGYGVVEDEAAAADLCAVIDKALVEQGLVGGEVDGREAAKAAGGELKLLAQPAGIEHFEIEKEDKRWSMLEGGLDKNNDLDGNNGEVKLSKSAQRKLAKEAKNKEAFRRFNPEADEEEELEALPIYLDAVNEGKGAGPKDVVLHGYDMFTPDGGTQLLSDATLRFPVGRRFGLVGRNGIGKTTLLKRIAQYQVPGFPIHLKILHVKQEVRGTDATVLQMVLDSDVELKLLREQRDRLERLDSEGLTDIKDVGGAAHASLEGMSLEDIYARLEQVEASTAEARAAEILNGLLFAPEMQRMPTKQLSGGWRMRVALACSLFVAPDILMLDEPTNHLDFPAVLWLEKYLQSYSKTVLVVSHDRQFLNGVTTDIVLFEKKQLKYYKGNFDSFCKTREEAFLADTRAYENQQMVIKELEDYIYTYHHEKHGASRSAKVKQVAMKEKALERIERIPDPSLQLETSKVKLSFPDPGKLRKPCLIQLDEVSFGYDPEKRLLEKVSGQIEMGGRVGMLGGNGVGKTTLIKVILGENEQQAGKVWRNSGMRVTIFTQHHTDQLDLYATPIEHVRKCFEKAEEPEVRAHLGKFGIIDELQLLQIGNLSGGQKSRVAFAVATWQCPHLLVLDEPTNHLDLETIEALIEGVKGFPGAVLLVSHDRHFLRGVAEEYWALKPGGGFLVAQAFDEAKKFAYGADIGV